MKRHARQLAPALGLFCTVGQLYAARAQAEDASAAETAAARTLAVDGLKLAQANNCTDAVPKLERAEKLYHSAVVSIRLGECYVSLGRLVEGTELLRKSLREPQPAEPAPALTKALERAQKLLDATKPRIAGLTIKVAAVQDMGVKIDSSLVPGVLLDTEIPIDPGEHSIDITAPGYIKSSTRLTVGEGEKKNLTLTLARDPNASTPTLAAAKTVREPEPAPSAAPVVATSSPPAREPTPHRSGAYVALGAGAAALATGSVLGLIAMQRHSDLKSYCPNDVCPTEKQGDLDSARKLGNFSTVAFAVGGAGVALGAVLFFTATPSRTDRAEHSPPRRFAGLTRAGVGVGLGRVDFSASF
jgi:hypothetical protein